MGWEFEPLKEERSPRREATVVIKDRGELVVNMTSNLRFMLPSVEAFFATKKGELFIVLAKPQSDHAQELREKGLPRRKATRQPYSRQYRFRIGSLMRSLREIGYPAGSYRYEPVENSEDYVILRVIKQ